MWPIEIVKRFDRIYQVKDSGFSLRAVLQRCQLKDGSSLYCVFIESRNPLSLEMGAEWYSPDEQAAEVRVLRAISEFHKAVKAQRASERHQRELAKEKKDVGTP